MSMLLYFITPDELAAGVDLVFSVVHTSAVAVTVARCWQAAWFATRAWLAGGISSCCSSAGIVGSFAMWSTKREWKRKCYLDVVLKLLCESKVKGWTDKDVNTGCKVGGVCPCQEAGEEGKQSCPANQSKGNNNKIRCDSSNGSMKRMKRMKTCWEFCTLWGSKTVMSVSVTVRAQRFDFQIALHWYTYSVDQ